MAASQAPKQLAAHHNEQEVVILTTQDGVQISAILMYPSDGINPHSPAIVFHHGGFGGHPARQLGAPRFAAERLSAMGYTTLSLLSRQSSGHIRSVFEESQKDIKAAIDFLSMRGIRDIILAGHSLGSIRIAGYLADQKDDRIKAAIHFAPTADMPDSLVKSFGRDRYDAEVKKAKDAIASGYGGLDVSPDPDETKGLEPDVIIDFGYTFQTAEAFLSWWGPNARTRNTDRFAEIALPTLLLAGTEDKRVPEGRMEKLQAISPDPDLVEFVQYSGGDHFFSEHQDQSVQDVLVWLDRQGLAPTPSIKTRLVDTKLANERVYPGLLYAPVKEVDFDKPAFVVVHGYTGTIATTSNNWLSQRLAQRGFVALAPMTRSSGLTGIVAGKMEYMVDDLSRWLDYLEAEGHREIVLIGHSLGGIWSALYLAETQDPRVAGSVFMAPTRSLPGQAKLNLGASAYIALVNKAKQSVADGNSDRILVDKYYQSPPAAAGTRSMFIQQASSWLDYWGPESDAVLTARLADIEIPMLSLAGSQDQYVDKAYMLEVKDAAKGSMDLVWYGGSDGANHGFHGYEDRVSDDIVNWVVETLQ